MTRVISLVLAVFLPFIAYATPLFQETFETSIVGGTPSGWSQLHSGKTIYASNAAANDGSKSVYLQGQPYWGADIQAAIPSISSGTYNVSFSMKVDTSAWTGTDGDAKPAFYFANGKYVYFGIRKVSGVYRLMLGASTEQLLSQSLTLSSWNKFLMKVNFDTQSVDFYVNGTLAGSGALGTTTTSNAININSGNAGAGGGYPAAYYDTFTIEQATTGSEEIIFSKQEASGKHDLWMMNSDGSEQQRLTDEAKSGIDATSPAIYASGTKVIYQRDFNIASLDLTTLQVTTITTDGATSGAWAYGEPRVSPDGTKIAYTYGQSLPGSCSSCTTFEIYRMSIDGTNKTRITNNSYRDATPIWSPDGAKLMISHYQGAPSSDCCNQTDVYILDLATKAETKLYGTSNYDWGTAWTSAGILHSANGNTYRRINSDGTGSTQVCDASRAVSWAIYSPDSSKMLYNTNSSEIYELYVANADGTNPTKISSGINVDGGFDWGNISAMDQATGLVAYYPFSGNANDASGSGNNGTINGVTLTSDRFGNANSAYSFNGTSSYIDGGASALLNPLSSLTASALVKMTGLPTGGTCQDAHMNVVIKGNDALLGSYSIGIANSNGCGGPFLPKAYTAIRFADQAGLMPSNIMGTSTLATNTWYLLTTTYDGAVMKLYVNGILDGELAVAKTLASNADNLWIGRHTHNSSYPYSFIGAIDDVRIYSRALSAAEVQTLSTDGSAITTTTSTSTSTTTTTTTSSTTTTTQSGGSLSHPLNLNPGWNLLGNGLSQPIGVASVFGDSSVVTTVWKWITAQALWQFYTPTMDSAALQSYAAGKGYGVLSTINPGEGYWINAKQGKDLGTRSGSSFKLAAGNLTTGWNLVATGDNVSPSVFNANLSDTPPSAGTVPTNLTTLWAWDNPTAKWYFYAPSLESQGGTALRDYATGKGYLDFGQQGKTLGNGIGFWVNRP